ncbi:hypothetical protein [Polaribacter sp. Hel1_85]|uniref:hypothetical protein n=1 Tax=Polaribacter sp. Hel1_85 TaxID=1250005 RepID=UPI00052CA051|nr:hypothetical protein [Polaribacter sp. Hel1_85]KGL64238.1 hypothetical protein PHEL85_1290 [Polaribacter sp. Hel1_85]
MQLSIKFIIFSIFIFFFNSKSISQNTYQPKVTGYVNFNLGNSTLNHNEHQFITLFGCNTVLSINSKFWKGSKKGFEWNKKNQVLSGIPFGYQKDYITNKPFYISKYYIASPPVFKGGKPATKKPNTIYDIGLVTPDKFILKGEKPAQMVYLDYSLLKPMFIKYIKVKLDASFEDLKVDYIPFKVECNDFPWINTKDMKDAKGASGIGVLNRNPSNTNQLFLPYYYENETKKYLNCEVTILNDILFHREIFFMINGVKHKSINLKEYHKYNQGDEITLHAKYKEELPCGCKKEDNIDFKEE